ncbi:MAG: hypothetical protein VKK04_22475 [Synechococcales bacterium]|nr:hypothetical protein [Synechococcales bacterium]
MRSRFLKQWLVVTLVMYVIFGVAVAIAAGILALMPLLLVLIPLLAVGLTFGKLNEDQPMRYRGRSDQPPNLRLPPRLQARVRQQIHPGVDPAPTPQPYSTPTLSTGHCLNCRYFSGNSILPCAVNPSSFPRGCREFEQK